MASVVTTLIGYLFGSGSGTTATAGLIPTFFSWLTSATVLPYFAIGIAVSLLLLAVKVVRGAIWGN